MNKTLNVYGNGSAIKDYLFIDDLCSAVVSLLKSEASGTFNIGSGQGVSLSELFTSLGSVVGKKPLLKYEPAIPGDVGFNVLDCRKIRDATGWQACVPLDQGIEKSWLWIRPRLPD